GGDSGLSTAELPGPRCRRAQHLCQRQARPPSGWPTLRQARESRAGARLGGAGPRRLRALPLPLPPLHAPSALPHPAGDALDLPSSCPHSSPGIRAGRLSNGSRAPP
uniref:Mobile element protein n=1 Tax=Macrostomum lignano TaxID=282301 RepID=A0A1I8FDX8_9PLAT